MIPEQRRSRIIVKLREQGICSIDGLAKELEVSRITIQRDINLLVIQGLAQKVHGGVQLKEKEGNTIESRFSLRLKQNYNKKLKISKTAAGLVKDSSIIFLDSSTTVFILAKELFNMDYLDLTMITSSPAIIFEGMKQNKVRIIATGGELRSDFNMFSGSWVLDFLEKVNINSAFISAAGISPEGHITSNNRDLANTIRAVFKRSVEVNLLADSDKFYRSGMLDAGLVKDCTRLITDKKINGGFMKEGKALKDTEIIY